MILLGIFIIGLCLGTWIGAGIHMWLSHGKIQNLYTQIDELERSKNGFINELGGIK